MYISFYTITVNRTIKKKKLHYFEIFDMNSIFECREVLSLFSFIDLMTYSARVTWRYAHTRKTPLSCLCNKIK